MIDNIKNRNLWILLNKIWKQIASALTMSVKWIIEKVLWTWTVYKYTVYRNEKFRSVKSEKFFYNTAILSYHDHLT